MCYVQIKNQLFILFKTQSIKIFHSVIIRLNWTINIKINININCKYLVIKWSFSPSFINNIRKKLDTFS